MAFTVSGREVTWNDAIAHARETGAWDALEREVSEGVTLLHAMGADRPTPQELKDAATSFRYARRLVAAEELEAWLERWSLTMDGWMDHLRRTTLRTAYLSEIRPTAAVRPGPDGEIAARVWSSAVCSGTLERAARELAGLLAVCDSLAQEDGAVVAPSEARAALARRVLTAEALAAHVRVRTLDWLRIDSEVVSFTRPDAAREALSLLRHDGLSAAEVAGIARAGIESRIDYLEDVEEELQAAFTGSAKGDILGPYEKAGVFRVIVVHEKVAPSRDDPEVRSRAGASLLERAIRRETDDRVVWHGDP